MPGAQALGTSIHLYLADGVPDGLWLVEKDNWTGIALAVPRSIYTRVRATRQELTRAGAYVLVGPSETNPDRDRVYIGEADVLRSRLDQHYANNDFWTSVVVFTKKDSSLNRAHARYLESRLVALAHGANRAEVENRNAPQLPALSEAEAAATEAFLDDMLVIYPVVGLRAFEELVAAEAGEQQLYAQGPGANARGRETAEGFIVLAGSVARREPTPALAPHVRRPRQTLIDEGVLEETPEGLRFARDYLFNSPSQAAGVVLGTPVNGRTAWKDASGKTLKEIQSSAVEEDGSSSATE